MNSTDIQFKQAVALCRNVFQRKLNDYGTSWRLMRPSSITDQLLIKASRIRSLETKGNALVDEGILGEFIALVNYGIVGLIQLQKTYSDHKDMSNTTAMELYDTLTDEATELMVRKNHDYDEIWRKMRVSSYTDLILTKIMRVKEIEDNAGVTEVSEGIDANYLDIINYAVFGIIKLTEAERS